MEDANLLLDFAKMIAALALVIAMMLALSYGLKRFGVAGAQDTHAGNKHGKRLSVNESMALGPRHRLVLIQRDEEEHLVILGPQSDLVIETGIKPSSTSHKTSKKKSSTKSKTKPKIGDS